MALQPSPAAVDPTQKDDDSGDDSQEFTFPAGGCCCFWNFPCDGSRKSDSWERISASEKEQPESNSWSLWSKGVKTLKKAREWSEIVAGPKWKTFIRRFNKTPSRPKSGKFQYDPMSYALNFDDGAGQNGQFEEDTVFRNFSSRYAAIPVQNGQLKDSPP